MCSHVYLANAARVIYPAACSGAVDFVHKFLNIMRRARAIVLALFVYLSANV